MLIGGEQLVEQRAIVDERLPLALRPDVGAFLRQVNVVGRAVVLDDVGVIDGDVGGPTVEILDRITLSRMTRATSRSASATARAGLSMNAVWTTCHCSS